MRILRREEVWIHTHFVTNGVYLPQHRAREIQNQLSPILEELGLVAGLHFETRSEDKGLHIVLECLPFPETLKSIESALAGILKPIPARPRNTRVHIEPPAQPTSVARRQT
jgi:hypothetical protein